MRYHQLTRGGKVQDRRVAACGAQPVADRSPSGAPQEHDLQGGPQERGPLRRRLPGQQGPGEDQREALEIAPEPFASGEARVAGESNVY